MPSDSVIQFGALLVRKRYSVRFQAFPDCIQQLSLLCKGEAIYLL